MSGRIPEASIQALLKEIAGLKNTETRLVSLGDWISAGDDYIPIVCTSGEAETILSSGKLNLFLAGPQTDPGLIALCRKMNISVLFSADNPAASAVLKQARSAFDHRTPVTFAPDASLVSKGRVSIDAGTVENIVKNVSSAKTALIGGADTLQQSLGHLPVELTRALIGQDYAVASWGDAALWMLKQELPAGTLESQEGPLSAVRALAAIGKLSDLKGICFTGLKNCREFTLALGLAALGLKVSVAVPLPIWGSEKVRMALKDNLAVMDGSLAHYDHPAQADEILDWFLQS
jgi:hypothetical protein